MDLDFIRPLAKSDGGKIVLLVLDGLGGAPIKRGGPTELEAAETPNLDALAAEAACGLQLPVGSGITPGSGPGHLSLFGYDPVRYQIGRGVLSALGVGFDLRPGDVAARGNFCTVDEAGRVVDRRAGRIATEVNRRLLTELREIELPGVELHLEPVKEYRFLLVLRGEGLSGALTATDPQVTGVAPRMPQPEVPAADRTAKVVRTFIERAGAVLADEPRANMVLLRGFSQRPDWPTVDDVFGLKAAAVAVYPMYRGAARLVGMDVLETGDTLGEQLDVVEGHWDAYDFFFVHVKPIDSAGEDGDFARKSALIEDVDAHIPRLRALGPDVVVVTGDHSTPAALRYHSWHPVPVLLWSRYCRPDAVDTFGERACLSGALGPRLPAAELMPLALANAGRLAKYGA